MNRRQLLALGAGLVVGEPARRAYSFLNGLGFESDADRVRRIIAQTLRRLMFEMETRIDPPWMSDFHYDPINKRIICKLRVPVFPSRIFLTTTIGEETVVE